MATIIKSSVGQHGKNHLDDVRVIQHLLNLAATPKKTLQENGICNSDTINAITSFQKENSLKVIDGRVDPRGATIVSLLKRSKTARPPASKPVLPGGALIAFSIFNLIQYLRQYSTERFESDHSEKNSDNTIRSADEFKILVATVYGEAANSSETAWQAIAFVIKNRVGKREWTQYKTVSDIIKKTGFDAYTQRNVPYVSAEKYLNENQDVEGNNTKIEKLISVLTPVYLNKVTDITGGAVLYYSPNAQAALHKINPKTWKEKPNWNFSILTEVKIPGLIASDDFKFYKYK